MSFNQHCKDDVYFIEEELLPEMVHNRCFCEKDSREFVELSSAQVEPLELDQLCFTLYRARVVVCFSGEAQVFHVLIKLLQPSISEHDDRVAVAYDAFLNEEILWNKLTLQCGKDYFPKFYVADMGRYGRPVVVVQDLEKCGFSRVLNRELNVEEASSLARLIASFHSKAVHMKHNEFSVFREFYAKLHDVTLAQLNCDADGFQQKVIRVLSEWKETEEKPMKDLLQWLLNDDDGATQIMNFRDLLLKQGKALDKETTTICQGLLLRENLWFRNAEKLEVCILDWQRVRFDRGGGIDLATLLLETDYACWTSVIDAYIGAAADKQELCKTLNRQTFLYAFFISILVRNAVPMNYAQKIVSFLNNYI